MARLLRLVDKRPVLILCLFLFFIQLQFLLTFSTINAVTCEQEKSDCKYSTKGRVLKKSGYRLDKPKQKRNRKGKRRNSSFSENSLATLHHFAPASQGPFQSEGEGLEETKREPEHPFAGGPHNEAADCVNSYAEQSWQDREISDSSQSVVSPVELDHTPKEEEEEEKEEEEKGLSLTLPSSVPSESSASCHTSTQHLSGVVKEACWGMKVESQRRNRYNSALDMQGIFSNTPSSFMQKTEMTEKSCLGEFALHHQSGTRMSEEILREEQGVKSDCWALFPVSLFDEELQMGSENLPYFGRWPSGPHKFVYEQRPKKDRSRRLACPVREEQLIELISTSEGAAGSGLGPEIPMEKQRRDLSPEAEIVDLPRNPETNISRTCIPSLNSPEHPLESTEDTQGMQRRICDLPPNCKLLGQTPINPEAKEKCDLLTENRGLDTLFGKDISKTVNKDETKKKMMIFDCHLPWFYLDTLHDSPQSTAQQPFSYLLSFNREGCAVYFYKNPVPSLMLHYLSCFCVLSFNNKRALLTFESQKSVDRTLGDGGFIPSGGLSGQSAVLCSLGISSDTRFLHKRLGDELKTWETWEPVPAQESQDLISRTRQCCGPLSQELAFHPAKHFGSSGVPIKKAEESW